MKKVLALVMVLSMAGFASAALQLDVVDGKAVVSGQLDADIYAILTAGNGATLSGFAAGAAAPSLSGFFASSDEFAAIGVPIPAGFVGEGWTLASSPGEAYKAGELLTAGLKVSMSQLSRTWEETVFEGCPQGWWKIRTYTEVTDIVQGAIALSIFSDVTGEMGIAAEKSLDVRNVNTTFVDGDCIPEPMTLSLLGLGALVLRRRS